MRFTLKPVIRQLSLVFPALLIGLPLAMNAAEDRPSQALPPPSLLDVTPPKSGHATPPTVPAPAAAPSTAKPVAVAGKPASQPAAEQPAQSSASWWQRLFAPSPKASASSAAVAPGRSGPGSAPRGAYAYDSPNRTIRTGLLGQCVKTGVWAESAATADCHPALVAKRQKGIQAAALTVSGPLPRPGGSAPVPSTVASPPPRPEPVEVVPLAPPPPAAKEERALAPEPAHEEPITAVADATPPAHPEAEKLTLSAGALFPLSSTNIKPLGREKLDEFVFRLKEYDYGSVRIVGYTDPTGSPAKNVKLSKARADAVKRYLVSKGIQADRIETEGKGGTEPVAKPENCDALPRTDKIICYAPDRRVEIEVVGGKLRG
ncbi:MAG TPA: OmpA family protein [Burkholderiales bacterium]|nr:OmpA family protein [Burkholderiales bacterium]